MVVLRCAQVEWRVPTPLCFSAVKLGLILAQEADKGAYLNQLNARKPFL
jgi:hypothetical protein